jgi:hypothetical protein
MVARKKEEGRPGELECSVRMKRLGSEHGCDLAGILGLCLLYESQ